MKDFNEITKEDETLAKEKFRENGTGIKMGTFVTGDVAKWEDLINPDLFSMRSLKTKMLSIATTINTACNDELLGNLDVAFSVTDERDRKVEFTWLDMYTFLRAAYRYRMETAEYKSNKARIEKLEAFVESNKSLEDKLAEAQKELASLKEAVE